MAAAVSAPAPERALRADAERNLSAILTAAREVLAERGEEASVAEIASRAGVGTATLFRRFPTKDDLVFAVFEERLAAILAAARAGLDADDPAEGLCGFLAAVAEMQSRDRCLCQGLGELALRDPRVTERRAELLATGGRLLARAQDAGAVRGDLEASDLPFLAAAAALPVVNMGLEPELHRRYLRIVLDGLRPEGASALEPPAPDLAARGIPAAR